MKKTYPFRIGLLKYPFEGTKIVVERSSSLVYDKERILRISQNRWEPP